MPATARSDVVSVYLMRNGADHEAGPADEREYLRASAAARNLIAHEGRLVLGRICFAGAINPAASWATAAIMARECGCTSPPFEFGTGLTVSEMRHRLASIAKSFGQHSILLVTSDPITEDPPRPARPCDITRHDVNTTNGTENRRYFEAPRTRHRH